jgi:hypothetical protein
MRLPSLPGLSALPGPADVLDGATALRDGVAAALELVPRAAAAMSRTEGLLDQAEAMVTRAEALVTRADSAVTMGEAVANAADVALARSQRTLDIAEISNRDAARAVEGALGMLDRLDAMLTTWEAPLRKLAPAAEKFAASLDPAEVQAAISLIDRMPLVLDHLENDVLPMLRQMDRVGPDVHELLEVVEDLRKVVTGLPGVGLLRRRGEDEPPEIESVHESSGGKRTR